MAVYLNTTPWRPTLDARCLANQIELSLNSVRGLLLQIEQTTNLANPIWTPVQTITITNVPQLLTLPVTAESKVFWRAVVP